VCCNPLSLVLAPGSAFKCSFQPVYLTLGWDERFAGVQAGSGRSRCGFREFTMQHDVPSSASRLQAGALL
jgi:hypothetical protein